MDEPHVNRCARSGNAERSGDVAFQPREGAPDTVPRGGRKPAVGLNQPPAVDSKFARWEVLFGMVRLRERAGKAPDGHGTGQSGSPQHARVPEPSVFARIKWHGATGTTGRGRSYATGAPRPG